MSNFPQLDVPPSDSLDGAMGLNLPGFGTDNISRHLNSGLEDTGLLDDLDFEFDATGNIIDHHMLDDFPRAQFLEDHDIAQPDIPGTITPQENITTNIQSIVVRKLILQTMKHCAK